ncbi:hypothetical protein B0J12DRAFT_705367 [Macrophomina phaseolina]|uniref:Uncharacterized protein n=1 Tax=Macrophomina phaseolina TaxID=35725 RepID=A0ABQ8FSK4_9PEZI|nr:hypothetical protein B0J12DRAFT_705367 [Macrophomina phaseolina]
MALLPAHLAESEVPTIDNRHMLEPQLSSSRKRQCSEPPQPNETSQPVSKKQRLCHSSGSQQPSAFWDNLSRIWLLQAHLVHCIDEPAGRSLETSSLSEREIANPPQNTADYLRSCKPRILKDIKLFARHVGPDLSDLRNFPEPIYSSDHTMSSSNSSARSAKLSSTTTSSTKPTTNTTRTKSTGVYDRDFQQHLIDNAVYPHGYRYLDGSVPAKPKNWKDVNEILAQPRPSLSPSRFTDEEYEMFVQADADAHEEKASVRIEQLSRKVRDELGGQIIPSTQHDLPVAPNFFLAAKGPDGSLAVAGRQACYDGALGARGMHGLQSYQQDEPIYDNNAYTITSIYHGGQLKMYTSHVAPPRSPGGRPEYHMSQINTWGMTGNADTFRQGARAYRNARDWAKEQRDEAIRQANERVNPVEAEAPTIDAGASTAPSLVTAVSETEAYPISQESRTSLNEDSNIRRDSEESDTSSEDLAVYRLPAKRSNKYSKHSQTQRKRRNADVRSEQSERWSWIKGKFQRHKGQDLVKEQNNTPADVRIYFDEGWPGQEGKKWRLWISATREILFLMVASFSAPIPISISEFSRSRGVLCTTVCIYEYHWLNMCVGEKATQFEGTARRPSKQFSSVAIRCVRATTAMMRLPNEGVNVSVAVPGLASTGPDLVPAVARG